MAFGNNFYNHGVLRKYVVAFGQMFSGITIERTDSGGTRIQSMEVPLSYSPKEKFLVRLNNDPNLERPHAISLPRMGFEITSLTYDSQRALNSTNRNKKVYGDNNRLMTMYQEVPYTINFSLYIMVKNANDGVQIVEQILPYFTPEWTISMNLVPEMGIIKDTPFEIQDVSLEDVYDGDFESRRALVWNLNFTVKGWLFGPINKTSIIKRATVSMNAVNSANNSIGSTVTDAEIAGTGTNHQLITTPGLTAAGTPTANSANSIGISQIDAMSNYGFIQEHNFYNDGVKR